MNISCAGEIDGRDNSESRYIYTGMLMVEFFMDIVFTWFSELIQNEWHW